LGLEGLSINMYKNDGDCSSFMIFEEINLFDYRSLVISFFKQQKYYKNATILIFSNFIAPQICYKFIKLNNQIYSKIIIRIVLSFVLYPNHG
jgi:hypothetical protein